MSSGCNDVENQGRPSASYHGRPLASHRYPSNMESNTSQFSLLEALNMYPSTTLWDSDHQLHYVSSVSIPMISCSNRDEVLDDNLCANVISLSHDRYNSTLNIIECALNIINAADGEDHRLGTSGKTCGHNNERRTHQDVSQ